MISARSLRRELTAARKDRTGRDVERFWGNLAEAMGHVNGPVGREESWDRSQQQVKPNEFSIRELFEELVVDNAGNPCGRTLVESFSPRKHGRNDRALDDLMEAGVNTAMFTNITGQIFFTSVLDAWQNPALIGTSVTENVPTDLQTEEKIPGISVPGDEFEEIGELEAYPEVGVTEEWVMTPDKVKEGFILPVSKEAVFGDRTGVLLARCSTGAEMMAINKEKRILDAVLGVSTLYRRNGGAAQATYGNTHTQGDFDNLETSALVDWTDIEAALLLFDAIDDPNTGEPIMISPRQVIVPSALLMTARYILNATAIQVGDTTSATVPVTMAPNPLSNPLTGASFELLSNQYVQDRTSSTTQWFIGDFPRGFKYLENWGITTEEEREGGPESFNRDVVARFKTSEKGVAAVVEPRYAVRGN